GWMLKSVVLDGTDVTDSGVEFVPGRSVEGLQVVLTRKLTNLSGTVTDDRNRPVLDATVIMFPANSDDWRFASRYMRTSRPDTDGRYKFEAMPPREDYLLIAVQNLEPGQAGDPEFLAKAREQATPISLNEGETKAVDVKLAKLVP
ncbi:MAG: carboxypeptidase-like regulatory domain-containing protein, partial [Mycobacterium sp.]